jgi:hypothetical protein
VMKSLPYRSMVVALVLVVAACVGLAGCFGGGGGSPTTTSLATVTTRAAVTTGSSSDTLPGGVTVASDDQLSTFRSKDPFVPQAQPVTTESSPETTLPGGSGSVPTGGTPGTVTTIPKPVTPSSPSTSPSGGTGATGGTGTPSTLPTSTTVTTAPHVHTLRILSIAQVGGQPAVTFQVDGSVYRDKRTGDVVSTSWGQIKVVDINTSSRVVTLLQGSETLVLSQGQLVYQ